MISKIISLQNKDVTICYDVVNDLVAVFNTKNIHVPFKTFSGFDGLKQKFDELYDSFSESVDINDVLRHFTPNIAPLNIVKP